MMNEYFTGNSNGSQETGSVAAQAVMSAGQVIQPTPIMTASPVVEPEQQEEKMYTLRGLCATDIVPMVQIIRKIGLKDIGKCFDAAEIKAITDSVSGEDTNEKSVEDIAETIGISVVLKIVDMVLENLSTAEQEIFTFLAGLSGMTPDAVGMLPMDVFFEMLVDVFKKKEFVGFMKVVSKLLK